MPLQCPSKKKKKKSFEASSVRQSSTLSTLLFCQLKLSYWCPGAHNYTHTCWSCSVITYLVIVVHCRYARLSGNLLLWECNFYWPCLRWCSYLSALISCTCVGMVIILQCDPFSTRYYESASCFIAKHCRLRSNYKYMYVLRYCGMHAIRFRVRRSRSLHVATKCRCLKWFPPG